MENKDKIIKMYVELHGDVDTSTGCSLVVYQHEFDKYDEEYDGLEMSEDSLVLFKDGNYCWHITKSHLLFDYVTKDWV